MKRRGLNNICRNSSVNICKHGSVNICKIISVLAVVLAILLSVPVFADSGPKPSVHVSVDGLPGHTCYATLLGSTESYGPYQNVIDSSRGRGATEAERNAYDAFKAYAKAQADSAAKADASGDTGTAGASSASADSGIYYFWGQVFSVAGGAFSWGYYPPRDFKILIYDPESGQIYASPEVSRYAFDSYFRVTLQDGGTLDVRKTPYLTGNIINFLIRVAVTLAVELAIALLFGYRKKQELRLIIIVNIITQVILNLVLSVTDYYSGTFAWLFFFPVMEIVVFVIEAAVCMKGLKSYSKKRAVLYALAANVATAIIGLQIALSL